MYELFGDRARRHSLLLNRSTPFVHSSPIYYTPMTDEQYGFTTIEDGQRMRGSRQFLSFVRNLRCVSQLSKCISM